METVLSGKREMIRSLGEGFFEQLLYLKKEKQEGFVIMAGENGTGIYCIRVHNPSFKPIFEELTSTQLKMNGVFVSILGLSPEERIAIQVIFFKRLFGLTIKKTLDCLKQENPDQVIPDRLYDKNYHLYGMLKVCAGATLSWSMARFF